ncbi:MAG: 2Fe-2S iron-sulfur cluster-binding protein [Trueperaceae bacterium]
MPTITVDGRSVDVEHGSKLVLAIEALGIDIGHRCGGKARCTTCRVDVVAGEPETFTRAEYRKLREAGLLDEARLSCQLLVEHDMTVKVLKTLQSEGWADTGPAVAPELTPEPQRFGRDALEAETPLG